MKRVFGGAVVVGLLLTIVATDSYATRPPTWDIAIPIWLGDPDQPALSRSYGPEVRAGSVGSGDRSARCPCGVELLLFRAGKLVVQFEINVPAADGDGLESREAHRRGTGAH